MAPFGKEEDAQLQFLMISVRCVGKDSLSQQSGVAWHIPSGTARTNWVALIQEGVVMTCRHHCRRLVAC
jgi:hypothetical protein